MLNVLLYIVIGVVFFYTLLVVIILLAGERGLFFRASTKKFMREAGLKRILNPESFLHGYIYFRWLRQYVSFGVNVLIKIPFLGPLIVRKKVMPNYHAKTITPGQARAIVTIDRDVPLQDLEHILPYPNARDFLLKAPAEIAVTDCACRLARENPCKPTQVCMIIGQPFVDFIQEHDPAHTRRISRKEALELLEAEHKRGHVHSVWFKDATIDRLWAICNCCACCCAGMEFVNERRIPIMCSSGYVAAIDVEKCETCGKCARSCGFNAIMEIKADKSIRVEWDKCMGCGVCVSKCPTGAIQLQRDEKKGSPLDVEQLLKAG